MSKISPKLLNIKDNKIATDDICNVGFMKTNRTKGLNSNSFGGATDKRTEDWSLTNGRFPTQLFCNIKNNRYKYVKHIT